MHGVLDALVTAATADVARHRFPYLVMGGFWIVHQERGGLHDLPRLAKAALRHVDLPPSLLNGMIAGGVEAVDGGNLPAGGVGDGGDAGAHGLLVQEDRARATQGNATAEFGAGQSYLVAEKP